MNRDLGGPMLAVEHISIDGQSGSDARSRVDMGSG